MILDRIQHLIEELRGEPTIVVREPKVELSAGLDAEYEAELADETPGFVLDDSMREVWGHVDGVEIMWQLEQPKGGRVGGIIAFEPLLRFARTIAWTDADLEAMAPRDESEARLLQELHPIDVRDGGMWSAVRMRPDEPYELWYRKDIDLPLRGRFADYLDLQFKARGADFWPLLLLDPSVVPAAHAPHVRMLLRQLRAALTALERISSARADARELLDQVAALDRAMKNL